MLLADFASYVECYLHVCEVFKQKDEWTRKSILSMWRTWGNFQVIERLKSMPKIFGDFKERAHRSELF